MARREPASARTAIVRPDQALCAGNVRTLGSMLLNGVHHVALVTNDSDRLHTFYRDVFDATVSRDDEVAPGMRLSFIDVGPFTELNVFQIDGNTEALRQTPMFERGRIDHLGLQAASLDAFAEIRRRLIDSAASDGFVTDFGPVLSIFFRDPDGLEGEVCVANPDAQAGTFNPPGTQSARFPS
jgi:catechol 2,3-dioxygenase-like lactoylglutathione lyase family enzyme